MTLHDVMQEDAVAVFCNLDDFAETLVYHKRDGGARTIRAVVDRQSYAGVNEDGGAYVLPLFEIHVANNAETGITSEELNLGGDFFEFSDRIGKDPARRAIVRLVSHDEGMLILECR
ncbi:hypothetical protein VN12_19560 [Pirellula sp. SH-Sr6A]|uniref:hypothetical protein n=1 Tax=Pirellula sp. SH-Sr6A TaxID=1632865 RepID=UPI00078CB0F6|nr:hypothetical protein [Pirellula sp. SH-Sr6A]AMV30908.1 hypothetical protein VN12_02250 [Pirellula sp. SH-Sr6A]AMV34332.1 hypothetical protein VN12_19560 [Pirellula sp. SH-Sr6A]